MKKLSKKEALDEMIHLFDAAEEIASVKMALANECVKKARRIAMKFKVRMPMPFKRRFCKECGTYFIPGKTYRVRMHDEKVVYTCLVCKKITRFPTIKRA